MAVAVVVVRVEVVFWARRVRGGGWGPHCSLTASLGEARVEVVEVVVGSGGSRGPHCSLTALLSEARSSSSL